MDKKSQDEPLPIQAKIFGYSPDIIFFKRDDGTIDACMGVKETELDKESIIYKLPLDAITLPRLYPHPELWQRLDKLGINNRSINEFALKKIEEEKEWLEEGESITSIDLGLLAASARSEIQTHGLENSSSFCKLLAHIEPYFTSKNCPETKDYEISDDGLTDKSYGQLLRDILKVMASKSFYGAIEIGSMMSTFNISKESAQNKIHDIQSSIQHPAIRNLVSVVLHNPNLEVVMMPQSSLKTVRHSEVMRVGGLATRHYANENTLVFVGSYVNTHTLIEEITHAAIDMCFDNNSKPFPKYAKGGMQNRMLKNKQGMSEEHQKFVRSLREDLVEFPHGQAFEILEADIHLPKKYYVRGDYYAEIPAKIIAMKGAGEWTDELEKRYPHMSQYCDDLVNILIQRLNEKDGQNATLPSTSTPRHFR